MLNYFQMEKVNNFRTRIAVRAILLDSNDNVLLTKRSQGTFDEGRWCLVGGKPDEDEDLEAAIIRETQEEVGTKFTPISYYGVSENIDSQRGEKWVTHYFVGKIDRLPTELGEREVSEVAFFPFSELQGIDIAFGHDRVLTKYFNEGENR
jgi:ADP-ribose pyrophosphatase YjhB (NUDIX family)